MSPPSADSEENVELPSVLRGAEPSEPAPTEEPDARRDEDDADADKEAARAPTPATSAVQPALRHAPKKETLKLFPFSGNMGEARPTPLPPAPDLPQRRETPRARSLSVADRPRAKGPLPRDPAAVHAALEPLLAWMPEEQRPDVTRQLLCGEYDGVLRLLSEHRQRYPRNLTIGKAIEVVEDAAGSRLLHELGPLTAEIIVVGSESAGRGNVGALLRLARQAATLGELLDKTPLGRVRTLQLVSQLVKEGTLAVRTVARPTGFGVGALTSAGLDTVKRRLSVEMAPVIPPVERTTRPAKPAPPEEDDADALLAQLERATLPDPSEVAASLQKLRDRNLTPAVRPRVGSDRKRVDDRVDPDDAVVADEESVNADRPPPRDAGMSLREADAPGVSPKAISTRELSTNGDHADEADGAPAKADAAPSDADRADDEGSEEARASEPPRPSAVQDPDISEQLRRLRPEPIREGEGRAPPYLLLAVGGIGLIAIVLSLYALFGRQPEARPPAPTVVKPVETAAPTPPPTAAPTPPPAASTPEPPAVRPPETVTLEIEASPRYAQVYLDGTLLTKPFKRTIARDDQKHELRIEAGGYKTQTRTFTIKGDMSFVIALEPILGRKKTADPETPAYP